MSFIRRMPNSVIVDVNQNPQTESPVQIQAPLIPNFGIAKTADQFEAAPENFYYLEEQAQSASLIQPSQTRDITVEASSLFSSYEPSVGQLDNRLPQLMDRLNALNERSADLQSQIEVAEGEKLKAQKALASVTEMINSNLPITDELRKLLEPIGIVGMIADLPIIPAVVGLEILYKQKLQKIRTELERKIGEIDINIESLKSQLDEVQSEMNSVSEQIAKEKERQAKEAQPSQTRDPMTATDAIVAEQAWQEVLSNQDLTQMDSAPAAIPFNPIIQKNIDE